MFELKNIKHFDEMSRETYCYMAELYLDGEKVANVENDGHGGCDMQYWVGRDAREKALAVVAEMNRAPEGEREKAEAIRQRILKLWRLGDDAYNPSQCELPDPELIEKHGDVLELEFMREDIESICTSLLNDHLLAQDMKRLMRKRVLYTRHDGDGEVYQTKAARTAKQRDQWAGQVLNWPTTDKVLNLLPIEEAMKVFREGVQ